MTAWGRTLTSRPAPVCLLPPNADMTPLRHWAVMCQYATSRRLFDHLVGAGEQRWWHFEAECLRGLQIDNELKLRWLQNGQGTGLFPMQHPPGIDADLPISINKACSI